LFRVRLPVWASYVLAAFLGTAVAAVCSASLVHLIDVVSAAQGKPSPGLDPWVWAGAGAALGWTISTVTISTTREAEAESRKQAEP
jgi:hypothetical protein